MSPTLRRPWHLVLAGFLAALAVCSLPSIAAADVSIDPPPGKVVFDEPSSTVCPSSFTVRWHPAPGEEANIAGYRLQVGSVGPVSLPASARSYTANGVGGIVQVSIAVADASGQLSLPQTITYSVPVADCKPTRPIVTIGPATLTTITLNWSAPSDPEQAVKAYRIYMNGALKLSVAGTQTSATITGLSPGTTYSFVVSAVDDRDLEGEKSLEAKGTTLSNDLDTTAPTTPADASASYGGCGSFGIHVRWSPSTDTGSGVKEYELDYEGTIVRVPAGTTEYTFKDVGPDPSGDILVTAIDNAGNRSEPAYAQIDIILVDGGCGPQRPSLLAGPITANSITLSWSSDISGEPITYNVYRNGARANAAGVLTTTFTLNGLTPDTWYSLAVEAIGPNGRTMSLPLEVKTLKVVPPPTWRFAAKGTTALKTLVKGNLPLSGALVASPAEGSGTFPVDLSLANTSGRLIAAGFLPVTAKIGFATSGQSTGRLTEATDTAPLGLSVSSKVRIKVLDVKLFGAIPLVAGNNCQTKQLTDLTLSSVGAFDPATGGKIAGTYALSNLNGCGALNGLVSPLTAGGGNTMSLTLTPQA